jgi:hypothetical protein
MKQKKRTASKRATAAMAMAMATTMGKESNHLETQPT